MLGAYVASFWSPVGLARRGVLARGRGRSLLRRRARNLRGRVERARGPLGGGGGERGALENAFFLVLCFLFFIFLSSRVMDGRTGGRMGVWAGR